MLRAPLHPLDRLPHNTCVCMHMYTHARTHTCMHAQTHMCTCTRTCSRKHAYTCDKHVCMYARTHAKTHAHMPTCIHVQSMYVLIHECVYLYAQRYAHVCTCRNTRVCSYTHVHRDSSPMYTCGSTLTCVCLCKHICACAHTCTETCLCVRTCKNTCPRVHTCTHTHSHMHHTHTHTCRECTKRKWDGTLGLVSGLPCDEEGAAIGAPSAIVLVVWGWSQGCLPPGI